MKRLTLIFMVLIPAVCVAFAASALAQHEHPAGDAGRLGKVNFPGKMIISGQWETHPV